MGRSVHISTEIPPPLSSIEDLGISEARRAELRALLIESAKRLNIAINLGHPRETVAMASAPETEFTRRKQRRTAANPAAVAARSGKKSQIAAAAS